MTRAEIRTWGTTLGGALALIVLILGAQGVADRIDRETDARIEYQRWLADACTPAAGQTAVTTNSGRQLSCTIYSKTGIGYAREVVSVAVLAVQP